MNNNIFCEKDLNLKNNIIIFLLFFLMIISIIFIFCICFGSFRSSADKILSSKEKCILSSKLIKLNEKELIYLSGEKSLNENNESLSIDDAISKYYKN